MTKFKTFLYTLLSYFILAIDKLKGERSFYPLPQSNEDELIVEVKMFFGYEIEIYVTKLTYCCEYKRKWFKKKYYTTYNVHCKTNETTPIGIKDAFSGEYTLPRLLPTFIPVKYHFRYVVDSYLDMVMATNVRDVS